MKHLFLAALLLPFLTFATLAQEAGTEEQFDLLTTEGVIVGSTIPVNAAFAAEYEIDVPAPFSFLVPTTDDVQNLTEPAPKPGLAFIRVSFATHELRLIENLRFFPLVLPMGSPEQRVQTMLDTLANEVFDGAMAEYEEHIRDLSRPIKVGDYDGVEVIGRFQHPDVGLMYLRIVGIINPDSENSVFSISNVVASLQNIPKPDDFAFTRSGTALRYFKYLSD